MENRLGNSNGVGISKKSRSLDLKTLYKSSIPKDSVNKSLKRKNKPEEVDDQQKQDKKSRKVVSLSSFEKFDCGNGKRAEKACNGDKTLDDLVDSKVDLDEKMCNTSGLQGISLGLGGSLIYVPRRRRGFVGRSRFENCLGQKSVGESVIQAEVVDLIPKEPVEESSSALDHLLKVREKGSDGEGKGSDSASQLKLENGYSSQPAVKDGQLVSEQTHSKSRKRKPLALDNRTVGEEAKLSGATSGRLSEVSREDDEENLEANAARMLCSRFDPTCTEFSSNTSGPVAPSVDRLPPLSSGKNSKCVSDDTDDRMLRPRRKHEEKGTVRKRRHFYEILFSDVDSLWLLNKRIKIFWPLDESWYHGLVDNYDEERNLHHVKYDDRDEEWINLQGERFKILLFPAEIPGNNQQKRRRSGTKSSPKIKGNDPTSKSEKQNAKIEDDSCMGNMESEPIITWLARSSHHFKPSTLKAVKQWQKAAMLPSKGIMKPNGDVVGDTVGHDSSRSLSSLSSYGLAGQKRNDSLLKSSRFSKHGKLPLVYYRRRFRNTKKGISEDNNVEVLRQYHVSKSPDPEIYFCPIENSGKVVELYLPWNNSKRFRLFLRLKAVSLMSYFLIADVIWLSRVALLLHHGTVVTMWPRVCLEMLFLNNRVGLRHLIFEGCLMEAVWLIFRILRVFDQSVEQRTLTDLQLPVSSIGFRLSCIARLQRHVAFGFRSFSEVKHSKWTYVEQHVRRHSLLAKHLPISECTYDNIKAFQMGQVLDLSVSGNSLLFEDLQKRSRHCEEHGDREVHSSPQSSDLASNIQGSIISSPNPTALRSTGQRSRSSFFGYLSHGWSDSKGSFLHTNFGNGPKKRRTQVSYSLPSGGSYSRNKGPLHKGLPHKRIRRSSNRKSADVSRGPQKDLESISCDANVLITLGDRGWREHGAHIVLEPFDSNEWRLVVKISGSTKYSYRAHQFLQPGSTNRFTHAMMWKGGKDWILEFPDRSQWSLFKEMHEECYDRNIRAASVRNIPIPGIRFIEKYDDSTEALFTRNPSKYIQQTEADVEMALDPLRVMYDMDTDDEQWLLRIHECSETENSGSCEITEGLFEKAMDMFEKAAYVKQRDEFTLNEIEELMTGAGTLEVMERIYEHWRTKRMRKGMPLIRHLQPPLWEKYQGELRDWELAMMRASIPYSCGSHDKLRAPPIEKPAMFAFCLKPRGLEVQHKGSKHRSQKKLSDYTHHGTSFGDHEGFNSNGRRSGGGFAFSGDERFLYLNHGYDYLDESPMHQVLPGMYLSRDPIMGYLSTNGNGYEKNHHNKFQRKNPKKLGALASTGDTHISPLYTHGMNGKRMRNTRWNPDFSEWHSPNFYFSQQRLNLDEEIHNSTDIDDYRLRDAASAAKRARALAKLKRERAERLSYKADLVIQKAAAALMCAQATKASSSECH
ncbi:PREDICTED: uncharacterized protein LOC104819891 isoform X2 [Tarenaya hassleriana]|uniref:uncharacterized protein LOC104819891 isoform X2 n=1 Tax=Tarenaya hassleriana TaxID=28532 RepID=UPI0008FD4564|nr:PREDICTED: uncharacterized protein LOC104819891 isoform X2 [Tarenaya hassleriana]